MAMAGENLAAAAKAPNDLSYRTVLDFGSVLHRSLEPHTL
jgi:hypothetical protein